MQRYIFPADDPAPFKVKNYTDFDIMHFLINVIHHKVDKDTHKAWCNIVGRDISVSEISPSGVQASRYSLRKQNESFKKSKATEASSHCF